MIPTQMILPESQVDPVSASIPLDDLPPDALLLCDKPDKRFTQNVRLYGILEPVILIDAGGGAYTVAAGRRRIWAARAADLGHIPARVYPAGWASVHGIALVENTLRSRNPASDYQALAALQGDGVDEDTICAATGLTRTELRARLKLDALIPSLRDALLGGRIRAGLAQEAASLDAEHQEELAGRLERGDALTLSDVRAAKRVTREGLATSLPLALFATPGAAPWWDELRELADHARTLVPDEETDVLAALAGLMETLDRHKDDTEHASKTV